MSYAKMTEKIIKVAFVLPSNMLPIPASKGGAIETLLTNLLFLNEAEGKFRFIFVVPDEINKIAIYDNSKIYSLDRTMGKAYDYKACDIVSKENVDFIIMEGTALRLDGCFKEIIDRDRLGIHLHNIFPRKSVYENYFGVTIAVSEYVASKWENKQSDDKIYILHNGIDLCLFEQAITDEEKNIVRSKYGFSDDDFIVIYCGRIVKEKGIKELIEAIDSIDDDNIKLLVIGSERFAEGNHSLFSRQIVNHIESNRREMAYVGYVNNDELYKYYQSADMQVIPSLGEESFGLVAVEGMCSGLPIIYTDSGALPNIVLNDQGIKISRQNIVDDLKTNIVFLKKNKEIAKQMGNRGRERAKMFSKEKYYAEFEKLIELWMRNIDLATMRSE